MTLTLRPARLTGPELQARRRDAEATQDALAALLRVNRSRIAAIEAMATPSVRATRRYLTALAELEAGRQ
jgi:DNA-binding XRE family transcriptional regulator